jgi:serine/threonine-protein kinase HipA
LILKNASGSGGGNDCNDGKGHDMNKPVEHQHVERIKVICDGASVGTLAMAGKAKIIFEYTPQWISNGFDLAPRSLAFTTAPQYAKDPLFDGLHGVFNDSLPDGWGLLLMDRAFNHRYGWARHEITPLDRLAYIGQRAMGCFEYQPEYEKESIDDQVDLASMAAAADQILAGGKEEVLAALRIQGGSPGGARPKVTVALAEKTGHCLSGFYDLPADYQHWLVKFRAKDDSLDMGRAEKAYADMAALAGITMPPTALQHVRVDGRQESFFSVQRFDRAGGQRRHVVTMAGLYYANFRQPCIDYQDVLGATAILTKDVQQIERCFRLMAFNVLAHNKDDHAKNFSFIRQHERWELAPAYDLTFNHGMGGEHMTAIAGSGNPGPDKLLQIAQTFHLADGAKIIAEVREAVAQWPRLAQANQVSQATCDEITGHLAKIGQRFARQHN